MHEARPLAHQRLETALDQLRAAGSGTTLFTGRYSHNNGVRLQGDGLLLDRDFTLANYLDTAGYQTAMAGKFLLSWPDGTAPPNFDKHTIIKGGYTNFNARVEGVSRQAAEYSTTFLGSSLRGYVEGSESNDAAPWFAYFAPQAPHIVGGWKSLAVPEDQVPRRRGRQLRADRRARQERQAPAHELGDPGSGVREGAL